MAVKRYQRKSAKATKSVGADIFDFPTSPTPHSSPQRLIKKPKAIRFSTSKIGKNAKYKTAPRTKPQSPSVQDLVGLSDFLNDRKVPVRTAVRSTPVEPTRSSSRQTKLTWKAASMKMSSSPSKHAQEKQAVHANRDGIKTSTHRRASTPQREQSDVRHLPIRQSPLKPFSLRPSSPRKRSPSVQILSTSSLLEYLNSEDTPLNLVPLSSPLPSRDQMARAKTGTAKRQSGSGKKRIADDAEFQSNAICEPTIASGRKKRRSVKTKKYKESEEYEWEKEDPEEDKIYHNTPAQPKSKKQQGHKRNESTDSVREQLKQTSINPKPALPPTPKSESHQLADDSLLLRLMGASSDVLMAFSPMTGGSGPFSLSPLLKFLQSIVMPDGSRYIKLMGHRENGETFVAWEGTIQDWLDGMEGQIAGFEKNMTSMSEWVAAERERLADIKHQILLEDKKWQQIRTPGKEAEKDLLRIRGNIEMENAILESTREREQTAQVKLKKTTARLKALEEEIASKEERKILEQETVDGLLRRQEILEQQMVEANTHVEKTRQTNNLLEEEKQRQSVRVSELRHEAFELDQQISEKKHNLESMQAQLQLFENVAEAEKKKTESFVEPVVANEQENLVPSSQQNPQEEKDKDAEDSIARSVIEATPPVDETADLGETEPVADEPGPNGQAESKEVTTDQLAKTNQTEESNEFSDEVAQNTVENTEPSVVVEQPQEDSEDSGADVEKPVESIEISRKVVENANEEIEGSNAVIEEAVAIIERSQVIGRSTKDGEEASHVSANSVEIHQDPDEVVEQSSEDGEAESEAIEGLVEIKKLPAEEAHAAVETDDESSELCSPPTTDDSTPKDPVTPTNQRVLTAEQFAALQWDSQQDIESNDVLRDLPTFVGRQGKRRHDSEDLEVQAMNKNRKVEVRLDSNPYSSPGRRVRVGSEEPFEKLDERHQFSERRRTSIAKIMINASSKRAGY